MPEEAAVKDRPVEFGPTFKGKHYPSEMRRQMWPLCCGMSILSGFKNVKKFTPEELVEEIEYTCTVPRPDFQIFHYETIRPQMTWLTLNWDQMQSPKIMDAIATCNFKLIGSGRPRGTTQGLYLRDASHSWSLAK